MIDPHALRTLIEQWRDFSTKPIGVNCAAGYDGITATLGKCADDLEAVLSALPETPWQPISTAPKDGRLILTWSLSQTIATMWWAKDEDPAWTDGEYTYSPTHWMPLPAPPPPSEEPT